MSNKFSKSKVISAFVWKLLERSGTQGTQLIVQIILARLLLPEDFGTIAIVLVFINFARVFVESGLNTALIQKKEADELDFSSVFYSNLVITIFIYLIIYFAAPYIANFFGDLNLVKVLRVLSLSLLPGVFSSIQNAYVSRNMMFKKLFFSSLSAVLVSGICGIIVAYAGLGVWALVVQYFVSQMTTTLILWFTVKWRPTLNFSLERIKTLFPFGSKLLISSLLYTIFIDFRTLIVGKMYTSSSLGYYNRGQQIPSAIVTGINGTVRAVLFPTMSSLQDDEDGLKRAIRRSVKTSSFLLFPMMFGLAAVAEPVISLLLGSRWLPAVPFLQIFCLFYAFQPIHSAKQEAIKAIGRSDISLKLEIILRVVSIVALLISIPFGIYAIALSQIVSTVIELFIIAWPNVNLFNYSIKEQAVDILPALTVAAIMGSLVYLIGRIIDLPDWQVLIVLILAGILIYYGLAKLFRIESLQYIYLTARKFISARKDASKRK